MFSLYLLLSILNELWPDLWEKMLDLPVLLFRLSIFTYGIGSRAWLLSQQNPNAPMINFWWCGNNNYPGEFQLAHITREMSSAASPLAKTAQQVISYFMAQMPRHECNWLSVANGKALTVEIPFLALTRSLKHWASPVCKVFSYTPAIFDQCKRINRLVWWGMKFFSLKLAWSHPPNLSPTLPVRQVCYTDYIAHASLCPHLKSSCLFL